MNKRMIFTYLVLLTSTCFAQQYFEMILPDPVNFAMPEYYTPAIAHNPVYAEFAAMTSFGRIVIWDLKRNVVSYVFEKQAEVPENLNFFTSVKAIIAYNPQGTMLAATQQDGVYLYDLKTKRVRILAPKMARTSALLFNHDGTKLIQKTLGKTIKVWDLQAGTSTDYKKTFRGEEAKCMVRYPQEDVIALLYGNRDGGVEFWSLKDMSSRYDKNWLYYPETLSFNHDGSKMAVGLVNGTIGIINVKGGSAKTIDPFKEVNTAQTVAFRNHSFLSTAMLGSKIYHYNLLTGWLSTTDKRNPAENAVFSEDGSKLAQLITRYKEGGRLEKTYILYTDLP